MCKRFFLLMLFVFVLMMSNGYCQLGNLFGNDDNSEPPPPNYTIEYNVDIDEDECDAEVNIQILNSILEDSDTAAYDVNNQITSIIYNNKELPSNASFSMSRRGEYSEFTVDLQGTAESCSNVKDLIKSLEDYLRENFKNSGRFRLF